MKIWSEFETKKAIELCGAGKNYQEIAETLGRTKKAIRVRLNRLGITLNNDIHYETISCNYCGKEFKSLKSRKRKFCSQSCSATINNKLFPKRKERHKNGLSY